MTQIKRKLGDYATSKFLNSTAVIQGGEGPAVITHVTESEVQDQRNEGGKRLAILLFFDRFPNLGYDCNTTNIRNLQDMFGEDIEPDDLRGRRVYLGTHQTNMGRGILISAIQGTVQGDSALARSAAAEARTVNQAREETPLQPLNITHNHPPGAECRIGSCNVATGLSLGHQVNERWPQASTIAPPQLNEPPAQTVGTGPQAVRVPSSQPQAEADDPAPGQYHVSDPGPADDDIPF